MNIIEIPLAQLQPHPDNSNVMTEQMLAKLAAHIERSTRYPPLVVRPMADQRYQILDGHHRAEALRRLQRRVASCVVWEVNDEEALVLMATLNRLEGDDDPRKRAALVAKLIQRRDMRALAAQLPEQSAQLKKLLELDRPVPQPRAPQRLDQMPQAVHFFLLPEQRKTLEAKLKQIGGTREAALMTLVEASSGDKPEIRSSEFE